MAEEFFTPQERRVLVALSKGTREQAAKRLAVAKRTIDFHLSNIFDKVGERSIHLVMLSDKVMPVIGIQRVENA